MSGTSDTLSGEDEAARADSITRGFLFADLRGYTEYVEHHGGEAAARLLARYRDLVRTQVARFRGAEIKTEGDSFYVVFPSASAAVRAGLAIVDEAGLANASDPQAPIRVGVGVHAGETIETTEGYVGSPVNIAARLCAQAAAGELLVSDTVRALTSTVIRARFVSRGRRQLKGIREPMQVFAVSDAAAPADVRPTIRARRPALGLGAAVLLSGVVVVAIAALALRGGAGSPASAPATGTATVAAASASATPSATATASGPQLSVQERNLLDRIPREVRQHCEPSPEHAVDNASATIHCQLPIGSGADTVTWHYFETPGETTLAFDRVTASVEARTAACEAETPVGPVPWQLPNTYGGRRVCFTEGDRAAVAWSYDADQILAEAIGADDEFGALDAWWKATAYYLGGFR